MGGQARGTNARLREERADDDRRFDGGGEAALARRYFRQEAGLILYRAVIRRLRCGGFLLARGSQRRTPVR